MNIDHPSRMLASDALSLALTRASRDKEGIARFEL